MSSTSSPMVPLALAALTAVAVAYGINRLGTDTRIQPAETAVVEPRQRWTASAQGRVEPKGGEIRLSALSAGRIESVLVKVNDKVRKGDLLVRIDDLDAHARVMGADAEAGVRKRERDTETNVAKLTLDRRTAEDRLNNTERSIALARLELDRLQLAAATGDKTATADQIAAQRKALDEALASLDADRRAYRQSQLAAGVPLPTRLEAGLTASRADLSLAEAALERTRVRAPFDGTVLQVQARVGEATAASPEQPLVVIGDLSGLQVKAEVEERDVARVSVGQDVVLKTDAFPDREFAGRVATIAEAMRPPSLAQRGPRRPNDLDTLEVKVDVAPGTPLLPGMRIDVFFVEPPLAGASARPSTRNEGPAEPARAEPATEAAGAAPKTMAAPPAANGPDGARAANAPEILPPLSADAPRQN